MVLFAKRRARGVAVVVSPGLGGELLRRFSSGLGFFGSRHSASGELHEHPFLGADGIFVVGIRDGFVGEHVFRVGQLAFGERVFVTELCETRFLFLLIRYGAARLGAFRVGFCEYGVRAIYSRVDAVGECRFLLWHLPHGVVLLRVGHAEFGIVLERSLDVPTRLHPFRFWVNATRLQVRVGQSNKPPHKPAENTYSVYLSRILSPLSVIMSFQYMHPLLPPDKISMLCMRGCYFCRGPRT